MAEEIINLPYQSFEYNSNQIPQSATTTLVTPNIQTCDSEEINNQSGPLPAGTPAAAIDASEIVDTPQGERLYRRVGSGFEEIGIATEFVNFPHAINSSVTLKVIKEVAVYLQAMMDAAATDGVTIGIRDGFRTMSQQQHFWDMSPSNPVAVENGVATGNAAARPGRSNHQNGIAFDFNIHYDEGRTFKWMTRNAWKYGFIRAVKKERWHWEYWGDWAGQEKPEWAKHSAWGANGHQPKTMFAIVPRIHTQQISPTHYWSNRGADQSHTDLQSGGETNTWIGYGNEHLPDKFDREEPGWDRA